MHPERDATQVLYVSLKMQAELLEALLEDGVLSPGRARPMVAQITIVADAWANFFEEGREGINEVLLRLQALAGPQN